MSNHAKRTFWKARQVEMKGRCDYCDRKLVFKTATVDHITPLGRGGPDIPTNWAIACQRCQDRKAAKLLSECGMQLRRRRVWGEIPGPVAPPKKTPASPPLQFAEETREAWRVLHTWLCPWCDYCGGEVTTASAVVDWILPAKSGGLDQRKNWALSCGKCATEKGEKTLVELKWHLLRTRGRRCVFELLPNGQRQQMPIPKTPPPKEIA